MANDNKTVEILQTAKNVLDYEFSLDTEGL